MLTSQSIQQRQWCTEMATANGNSETAMEWWKPGITPSQARTPKSKLLGIAGGGTFIDQMPFLSPNSIKTPTPTRNKIRNNLKVQTKGTLIFNGPFSSSPAFAGYLRANQEGSLVTGSDIFTD